MNTKIVFLTTSLLLTACVDGYSGGAYYPPSSPPRDCHYYGTCGGYNDRDSYHRPPPPPPYYDNYDRRTPPPGYYHDNDHRDDRHRKPDSHWKPPTPTPAPAPKPTPAPAPEKIIRPSCGPGFNFDGRSCVIIDKSKIKPGGSGRGNACPAGMWISGDRCVGK